MLEGIYFIWSIFVQFFKWAFSFPIELKEGVTVSLGLLFVGTILVFFSIGKLAELLHLTGGGKE